MSEFAPHEGSVLVQAFSGEQDEERIREMSREIRSVFPQAQVAGCSAFGEITNGKVTSGATSLSFALFDQTELVPLFRVWEKDTHDHTLGQEIAETLISENTRGVLLLSEGVRLNPEQILQGFQSEAPDMPLFGGASSDRFDRGNLYVFHNDRVVKSGLIAIALNNPALQVDTKYYLNWQPVGPVFTVTKSDGRNVYELDHKSIASLYRHYLGDEVMDSIHLFGQEFPLLIQQQGVSVARVAQKQNKDGSISYSASLNVGDKVQFSYGHLESILGKASSMLEEIREEPAEGIFIYSCMTRKAFMRDATETEIRPLQRVAPTTGFFTWGEFYHRDNRNLLLNTTMTVALLSEEPTPLKMKEGEEDTQEAPSLLEMDRGAAVMSTMNRLLTVISQDLGGLNDSLNQTNEELQQTNEELNTTLDMLGRQKDKLAKQQDSIASSLNYAKRIQGALLPLEEEISSSFPSHFILYQPRDVVSGDFYWHQKVEDRHFISVADCTGHGVPGAFMSMIGQRTLDDIVVKECIWNPAGILSDLHRNIQDGLKQQSTGNKDGMDMGIVCIDEAKQLLRFSGAKMPLIVIDTEGEMQVYRGDRKSIGGPEKSNLQRFDLHEIPLAQVHSFYLFSDGFPDQFGGPDNKKFMSKRLRLLLHEIYAKPMQEQHQILSSTLKEWIALGEEDQIDDITLLGVCLA